MNFDKILKQWEQTQLKSSKPRKKILYDWVDRYPPLMKDVAEKTSSKPPPVSEGHSVWLRRKAQDTLDLHGIKGKEALEQLEDFILSLRRRGLRKALIIHGKGKHSQEGPVLKPLVRNFLVSSLEVGQVGTAKKEDGGEGATWFILVQRSR